MPRRNDIQSILMIGAGPIVIGQACEFDYSGTQACRALKEDGYRVILVNSNPATIMTDPSMADATYVEPITPETLVKIIDKERPDALLPTMGGQTALNVSSSLSTMGVLSQYAVEMIGASFEVIDKAENRQQFREAMSNIGLECPRSMIAHSLDEAHDSIKTLGLPAIVRPSYTLGGLGGGIAFNVTDFENIVATGLDASPSSEVLIEESVLGWKEFEIEVVRDRNDNCIIVCSIENVDPMGVHTGDSITVAPALTLTDKEYQLMRDASIAVLREIGVETGGSNVQFAINPADGRMVIIEMNPRVSRSSALASKATGFPIAKVAAKLAVGYTLDELSNDITGVTPASFEPTIDYVVTKIPRFTFEKFSGTERVLGSSMKSVGEVMAIGRDFTESLQKCIRSLEIGLTGLDDFVVPNSSKIGDATDCHQNLIKELKVPRPDRILLIAQAFRCGLSIHDIFEACHYDQWFLHQIRNLVLMEAEVIKHGLPTDLPQFLKLKQVGFSDARLAKLSGTNETSVTMHRRKLGLHPVFRRIDTCSAEFASRTPYMYSTYEGNGIEPANCESMPSDNNKVIILGGGPNRIGQGIEFDYCCVHAAYALKETGIETIMVNCNPETVSTDYDTSDRLYFEPLTVEDVIEIASVEQTSGQLKGVIVQYGGQTPLKLAAGLAEANIPILGTSPDAIDLAEDRQRFQLLIQRLGLRQPANDIVESAKDSAAAASRIGYPVLVRPSYVLGGRAMRIIHNEESLYKYMDEAVEVSGQSPVLIDAYLGDAIEVDVDAISDGQNVFVAGIMEHIEEAGIHSGDSACSIPPHSLNRPIRDELARQTKILALALSVKGLMNVQYAVKDGEVFVLEVNPRASRTVPFVAKAIGLPVAKIAARVMAGENLVSFKLTEPKLEHTAVKEAVFPFTRFPGVDIILGPEMMSTGEVMGIDRDFAHAFAKSQIASGTILPQDGTVFVSVRNKDKPALVELAQRLIELKFNLLATRGTARALTESGISVETVNKVLEGRPHIIDRMHDGGVQLVINTTEGAQAIEDSFALRRTALMEKIPYYTTASGAAAAVRAIESLSKGTLEVATLQSYAANTF